MWSWWFSAFGEKVRQFLQNRLNNNTYRHDMPLLNIGGITATFIIQQGLCFSLKGMRKRLHLGAEKKCGHWCFPREVIVNNQGNTGPLSPCVRCEAIMMKEGHGRLS
jgi:hypothetical protein